MNDLENLAWIQGVLLGIIIGIFFSYMILKFG